MNNHNILWDWGTAYDLFCSLRVIHEPGHYGLRPSWAAGVRSRVPNEHREILEQVHSFLFVPKIWIFEIPRPNENFPKDGAMVLWLLSQLAPEERLIDLIKGSGASKALINILREISLKETFSSTDLENLRDAYPIEKNKPRQKTLTTMAELVSQGAESGDKYLAALKAYHRVFFNEEENRIQPVLKNALYEAKTLASQYSLDDLIETLSRGVRIGVDPAIKQWVFIPSYWISPLVSYERTGENEAFFIFGGRPPDVALVPGDVVPESLLRSFKAMADPTRLRILKYLAQENITPAEIARRLRLRAPTVTHHLNVLRLAGLVNLTLEEGNERNYTARKESLKEIFTDLDAFLEEDSKDDLCSNPLKD